MTVIDATLVKQLIRTQFPQWAGLPVAPVENGGWDNRTFRLGDSMSVRLPDALPYVAQVEKEHRWLPELRPHLPFPIPVPLGLGAPGADYPWPWSIYGWLDGKPANAAHIHDLCGFAADLARFLVALRSIDARNGPVAGTHNFHRGGSLIVYDTETRRSIGKLADTIDVTLAKTKSLRGLEIDGQFQQSLKPCRQAPIASSGEADDTFRSGFIMESLAGASDRWDATLSHRQAEPGNRLGRYRISAATSPCRPASPLPSCCPRRSNDAHRDRRRPAASTPICKSPSRRRPGCPAPSTGS
jgi:hypothetical protein